MPKVIVDGIEVEVPNGATVLQAAELAGKEIPRFCYHDRLSVAGNCRMCLVEVEKAPKPVASCAYPVADGMVVKTDSPMVQNARKGVMEFLLINHPLDCPICDQGGECDLQDQAMAYGSGLSRFEENKRAVKNKDFGPLVNAVMTRCIHCTRCIRFATEVAGVPELGATARGENMEVGTYVQKALSSELSGNLIDLCPVGALTSKPYAFTARPWELKKTDGIDVSDAVGANIRIDSRGPEVLRVMPRLNDAVNEEWLGDKGRFWVDGLKRRRLDRPWVKRDGKLQPAEWDEAFAAIAARLNGVTPDRIGALVGDQCDAESVMALKDLMLTMGSINLDCRQDGANFDVTRRDFYIFNSTIAGIDEADAIVLIGTNPRKEAPVLNARIRKRFLTGGVKIGVIGEDADLTYRTHHLGRDPMIISRAASFLAAAKRPMVILGAGTLAREDGAAVLAAAWRLAQDAGALTADWHGFNVLQTGAGRVGALDLGFLPGHGGKDFLGMMDGGVDVLWLLGADEFDTARIGADTFVVYQGHHGDAGAARADVILPGAAYTEKDGTWVNLEGRVQRSYKAVFPPGQAKEDWKILRAFSAVIDRPLPYDDLGGVRRRMVETNPVFEQIDRLERHGCSDTASPATAGIRLSSAIFRPLIANYYQTDPISRASCTMAVCTETFSTPVREAAE